MELNISWAYHICLIKHSYFFTSYSNCNGFSYFNCKWFVSSYLFMSYCNCNGFSYPTLFHIIPLFSHNPTFLTSSYFISHHPTSSHTILLYPTSSYFAPTSSHFVSHHPNYQRIILLYHTSSYFMPHHHTLSHITL